MASNNLWQELSSGFNQASHQRQYNMTNFITREDMSYLMHSLRNLTDQLIVTYWNDMGIEILVNTGSVNDNWTVLADISQIPHMTLKIEKNYKITFNCVLISGVTSWLPSTSHRNHFYKQLLHTKLIKLLPSLEELLFSLCTILWVAKIDSCYDR